MQHKYEGEEVDFVESYFFPLEKDSKAQAAADSAGDAGQEGAAQPEAAQARAQQLRRPVLRQRRVQLVQ